ncbi:MAG: hypothetical protein Q8N51_05685 [Gammaproteobacteria bacterium]|nr:hypothetical protein [Gammaproteobacteria bacterium]
MTTLSSALTSALTVKPAAPKVHHYFDLLDYINSIPSPEVAAQVAQSTAWRIDVMIISAARTLYKDIREELFNAGVDVKAELTLAMNQKAYSEQVFAENGSTVTGPVSAIKELMYHREAWHATAKALTGLTFDWKGSPKTYIERPIEDQFFEPGQMKVSRETKAKHMKGAQRMAAAYDHPEAADLLYSKRLARSEQKMADVSENLRDQAQGVANMFDLAVRHTMTNPSGETTMEFTSLSLDTRRVLINAAITAAERAEEWAAENRNMTDTGYDLVCLAALKVVKELRAQLKQPCFVVADQQEAASAVNTG